jgi:3-hydroxy-3-methylglutaryl CoA synthase
MTDPNLTEVTEVTIVEATPETTAIVKKEMPDATPETIAETAALFDAIKKRAAAEVQAAGDLTREAYLKALQKASSAIEQNKSIAKERMSEAVSLLKKESEKNWLVVDAIKTRAQAQVQDAGEVSREAYLKAVRQAREAVEQNKLIERDRIDRAVEHIHKETEKNWHVIVGEIESIGVRLKESAKSAWNSLTAFFDKSDRSDSEK